MTTFLPLTQAEKSELLLLARQSIQNWAEGLPPFELRLENYSEPLRAQGASFVTLTQDGELRGCIGAIEAYQPFVQDVCEHAVAAARDDYRFYPVQPDEVPLLRIEISRLSPLAPLAYQRPEDLLYLIHPCVDGVVMRDGIRRATFLPQVWEKLETVEDFLGHLSYKMGAPGDAWRRKKMEVYTYQVEMFCE